MLRAGLEVVRRDHLFVPPLLDREGERVRHDERRIAAADRVVPEPLEPGPRPVGADGALRVPAVAARTAEVGPAGSRRGRPGRSGVRGAVRVQRVVVRLGIPEREDRPEAASGQLDLPCRRPRRASPRRRPRERGENRQAGQGAPQDRHHASAPSALRPLPEAGEEAVHRHLGDAAEQALADARDGAADLGAARHGHPRLGAAGPPPRAISWPSR